MPVLCRNKEKIFLLPFDLITCTTGEADVIFKILEKKILKDLGLKYSVME